MTNETNKCTMLNIKGSDQRERRKIMKKLKENYINSKVRLAASAKIFAATEEKFLKSKGWTTKTSIQGDFEYESDINRLTREFRQTPEYALAETESQEAYRAYKTAQTELMKAVFEATELHMEICDMIAKKEDDPFDVWIDSRS